MGAALQRMLSSFYTRQLEVVLVGLENSGKTTLMNGKSTSCSESRAVWCRNSHHVADKEESQSFRGVSLRAVLPVPMRWTDVCVSAASLSRRLLQAPALIAFRGSRTVLQLELHACLSVLKRSWTPSIDSTPGGTTTRS